MGYSLTARAECFFCAVMFEDSLQALFNIISVGVVLMLVFLQVHALLWLFLAALETKPEIGACFLH